MNKFQAVLSLSKTIKESKVMTSKKAAETWLREQPEFKQGADIIVYELAHIDNDYYVIGDF